MTDWTDLPNGAVAAGGLPSGETVTALRDNVPAMAEGAPGSPMIHGLPNLVEIQQPTSDVSTITFDYDVTGMRGALVEFIGQIGSISAAPDFFLDIRASGGSWRRVILTTSTANGNLFMARVELTNLNDADGSGIVFAWLGGKASVSGGFDRSSAERADDCGYSARSEIIAQVRVGVVNEGGEIEGSNSNERAIAKLYVMPEPTREQSL